MTNKNNFHNRYKLGDYTIECDICGMKMWASQAVKLPKETGKGGMIVCPNDRDSIDWGLIPYKILPEESPRTVRDRNYAANPEDVPQLVPNIDLSIDDPFNTTPQDLATRESTWDHQTFLTWENWLIRWEDNKAT